jgi:ATP-dependent Clp protease adaptor protein ClpS
MKQPLWRFVSAFGFGGFAANPFAGGGSLKSIGACAMLTTVRFLSSSALTGSPFRRTGRAGLRASSDANSEEGGGSESGTGTATITKPKSQTKTPSLYRVILMNDDFTPMDFVIHVIQKFFNKDFEEATKIMLEVHYQGAGICGTFSYDIAETKVYQVNQYSRQNKHPLKCTMEKA